MGLEKMKGKKQLSEVKWRLNESLLAVFGTLITDMSQIMVPDINGDRVVAQCSTVVSYTN